MLYCGALLKRLKVSRTRHFLAAAQELLYSGIILPAALAAAFTCASFRYERFQLRDSFRVLMDFQLVDVFCAAAAMNNPMPESSPPTDGCLHK